jgi:hypothetical protein
MQISASAGLDLAIVNGDVSVAGNDAKQSSLLFPSPAPDTGADRRGHRNRLTPWRVRSIPQKRSNPSQCAARPSARLPSRDGSQVSIGLNLPAFPVLRRLASYRVGKCSRHSGLKVRRIPMAPHASSASRTRSSVSKGSWKMPSDVTIASRHRIRSSSSRRKMSVSHCWASSACWRPSYSMINRRCSYARS